jgi:hypothetical protein
MTTRKSGWIVTAWDQRNDAEPIGCFLIDPAFCRSRTQAQRDAEAQAAARWPDRPLYLMVGWR